jgi:hypothetical protein
VREDLTRRFFPEGAEAQRLPRKPLVQFEKHVSGKPPESDLIFVELHPAREKQIPLKADYYLPLFMKMELDLTDASGPLETRKSLKDVRRRVHKNGFLYCVSKDPPDFDDYYFNMYLPHVRQRFGEAAMEQDYQELREKFQEEYELIQIRAGNGMVAGALIHVDAASGEGQVLFPGVRHGLESLMKAGVTDAIYFYSFIRMRQCGLRTIQLGAVRPFLNDGSLQYKLGLGARFADSHMASAGLLAVRIESPAGYKFMKNHPFIAYEGPEIYRAVYLDPLSPEVWETRELFWIQKGLAGIRASHTSEIALPRAA